MVKPIRIQSKKSARKAAIIEDAAELSGVSRRTAQRVVIGDQKNEKVLAVVMTLDEKWEQMLKEMEKEIPNWTTIFNRNVKKSTVSTAANQ